MIDSQKFPIPFVLNKKEIVLLDGEMLQQENEPGFANNNGRRVLPNTVMKESGEEVLDAPIWNASKILPTGAGIEKTGCPKINLSNYHGHNRHDRQTKEQ